MTFFDEERPYKKSAIQSLKDRVNTNISPKPAVDAVNRVSEMSVKVDNILASGGSCAFGGVTQSEYNSLLHKYVTEINLNKLKFSRSKLDQSLEVINLEDETKDTEL